MEVKSSCSNTALDAISEVPEAERDVDMMSQEDEDFVYGSRNSLLNKDDDQVSEDEDISGSRNSLSGLKRWTTEENLSFQDHRGSRSELMETPLHDSHSNSTGKSKDLGQVEWFQFPEFLKFYNFLRLFS